MRRIAAALLAVPLLIVSAAACGSEEKEGAVPSVQFDDGKSSSSSPKPPKIDKGKDKAPGDLKVKVLKKGDGPKVAKSDFLTSHYLGQTWEGKKFDSSYDRKEPASFEIGNSKVIKGWDKGLVGQTVGSKVELVIPPKQGYGDKPPQGSKIKGGDTLVFVVDILDAVPLDPKGKKVPQKDDALPKIATTTNGKAPKITVPKKMEEPDDVVSRPIIESDGKKVTAKDKLTVHFATASLKNGQATGDTWNPQTGGAPQQAKLKELPGWEKGLVGKRVGSRVMVVVPAKELPKKQRAKTQNAGLVFSVDIIAATK
ncbi:FKBP-type peptidyl-prolyl cis-trans isomerase [Streptomyces sp. NPDC005438]|uniref:FKBP-type peptidyl-prolyl cis-trans isomerase n=1 Tax=Streptomyces sp. NPDC005438 TaxID=3156880 RepID=UPI0033BF58B9